MDEQQKHSLQMTEAEFCQRAVARRLEGAAKALAAGDTLRALRRIRDAEEQIGAWREMVIEDALTKR